jgi:hypothetical protein
MNSYFLNTYALLFPIIFYNKNRNTFFEYEKEVMSEQKTKKTGTDDNFFSQNR